MSVGGIHNLIHYLRTATVPQEMAGASDAQLLERYAVRRDEIAFELLVWRHAAMVLGVCHRVLGDSHDAEDAFQATFLILARKAVSVARHRTVAGWLHTVAYRLALRARARRSSRGACSLPDDLAEMSVPDPADAAAWHELRQTIDAEVSRLPDKYRIPFVLHHLEGRSAADVARELGCPLGTVECWLTRARQRLKARLARRNIAQTPALLAALAPRHEWLVRGAKVAEAALAAAHGATSGFASTAAVALADDLTKAMGLSRAKAALLMLLTLTSLTVLAAVVFSRTEAPSAPDAKPAPPPAMQHKELPVVLQPELPQLVKRASVLSHQSSDINTVALTLDGKTLTSAGQDSYVRVFDVATCKEHPLFQPDRLDARQLWPGTVAFSPDGKTVASGGRDNTVKLWDVERAMLKTTLKGHTVDVQAVAFSRDGKTLITAAAFHDPAALAQRKLEVPCLLEWKTWDLDTGMELAGFHYRFKSRIMSCAFSPNGNTLATGAQDGSVRLWDVARGFEIACFHATGASLKRVVFSPDSKTLATCAFSYHERAVKLWDVGTLQLQAKLEGYFGLVTAMAFAPDGQTLASGTWCRNRRRTWGEVYWWDLAKRSLRAAPEEVDYTVAALTFSRKGDLLVSAGSGGKMTLWEMR
jgi:RNA polymerase sigma factor (sigma-70 family)